ncbi:hypothetical protein Scep_027545 [Stephania cephalantha]|uniref:Aminotransferase-like plant mobile domain-containing protein n=1 Tax=Stephania cephalantha TaxID=152367 RepID=A0AAP0EFN1_9MAGN
MILRVVWIFVCRIWLGVVMFGFLVFLGFLGMTKPKTRVNRPPRENDTVVVGRSRLGECTKGVRSPTDFAKEGDEDAFFDTSTHKANAYATSFSGGPSDLSLLPSFTNHVLLDIWRNKGRGILKCINHGYQISTWKTIKQRPEKERVAKLINDSSLAPLGYISYDGGNMVYILGIFERWQPQTNTFHLPFGGMTITLKDVRVLLGILVIGKNVATPFKDCKSLTEMVSRLLEVSETDTEEEIRTRPGFTVSLAWFNDKGNLCHQIRCRKI